MGDTRKNLEASWNGMLRLLDNGGGCGGPLAVAGQYLQIADGDPGKALSLLPSGSGPFWPYVAQHLRAVASEDREIRDMRAERVTAIRR